MRLLLFANARPVSGREHVRLGQREVRDDGRTQQGTGLHCLVSRFHTFHASRMGLGEGGRLRVLRGVPRCGCSHRREDARRQPPSLRPQGGQVSWRRRRQVFDRCQRRALGVDGPDARPCAEGGADQLQTASSPFSSCFLHSSMPPAPCSHSLNNPIALAFRMISGSFSRFERLSVLERYGSSHSSHTFSVTLPSRSSRVM